MSNIPSDLFEAFEKLGTSAIVAALAEGPDDQEAMKNAEGDIEAWLEDIWRENKFEIEGLPYEAIEELSLPVKPPRDLRETRQGCTFPASPLSSNSKGSFGGCCCSSMGEKAQRSG